MSSSVFRASASAATPLVRSPALATALGACEGLTEDGVRVSAFTGATLGALTGGTRGSSMKGRNGRVGIAAGTSRGSGVAETFGGIGNVVRAMRGRAATTGSAAATARGSVSRAGRRCPCPEAGSTSTRRADPSADSSGAVRGAPTATLGGCFQRSSDAGAARLVQCCQAKGAASARPAAVIMICRRTPRDTTGLARAITTRSGSHRRSAMPLTRPSAYSAMQTSRWWVLPGWPATQRTSQVTIHCFECPASDVLLRTSYGVTFRAGPAISTSSPLSCWEFRRP